MSTTIALKDPRRYFEEIGADRSPVTEQPPVCLYLEVTKFRNTVNGMGNSVHGEPLANAVLHNSLSYAREPLISHQPG